MRRSISPPRAIPMNSQVLNFLSGYSLSEQKKIFKMMKKNTTLEKMKPKKYYSKKRLMMDLKEMKEENDPYT